MLLYYAETTSPIGRIPFISDGASLCAMGFSGYEAEMEALLRRRFGDCEVRRNSDPLHLKATLRKYFAGDLSVIDAIPVDAGGTAFQQRVWAALRAIPAGQTWTYGQLAAHLGQPQASRAVGRANALNPVVIVVPCHRVIGASLALTGYGGGLDRKRWLLSHEGALGGDQLTLTAKA